MSNRKHRKQTNAEANNSILATASSGASQINDGLATSTENEALVHRIELLEKLVNEQANKENTEIQQLKDHIRKLEEQTKENQIQIENLKETVFLLQSNNSKDNNAEIVISNDIIANTTDQSHVIIQREQNNCSLISSDINLTDDSTIQIKSECMTSSKIIGNDNNATLISEINDNDQLPPTISKKQPQNIKKEENKLPVVRDNYRFTAWMNSRASGMSIWSNRTYRKALLSYIGKKYGQEHNLKDILDPLRIEHNGSEELDQLYNIIKKFEEQSGAKESLREWQQQTRSNNRLEEIKNMFEYNSFGSSSPYGCKITLESNLEKLIDRGCIKDYFDMICRDGFVTAEIGDYLDLNKGNIIGGTDYESYNENVTFAKVDLEKSTIDLDANRVDLVTCFVTLHHIPYLQPILSEIVRILRPGGYLILREHDCKKERSLANKYLNFIHAFMMIARVGEFAESCTTYGNNNRNASNESFNRSDINWEQQKIDIISYTNSIQYRARNEWHEELKKVGFCLKGTLDYSEKNLQELFYAVYQLQSKQLN